MFDFFDFFSKIKIFKFIFLQEKKIFFARFFFAIQNLSLLSISHILSACESVWGAVDSRIDKCSFQKTYMLQTWLRWEPEPGFVRIFLARLCHFGELVLGAGNLESKFLRQIPLTYHIKHSFHFFFSVVSGIDPKNERKNHEKVELSSCRPSST